MNKLKLLAVLPLAAGTLALGVQAANAAPSVSLSPSSGPAGTKVTLNLSGFNGGDSIAVLQCKKANPTTAEATSVCNIGGMVQVTADSSGKATASVTIDKSWCASATSCPIGAGTLDQARRAAATFTISSGSSSSGSSSSGSSSTGSGSTTTDPTVNAGTGGTADREGVPAGVIALAAIGAVAVAGGAVRFARR